MDDDPLKVNIVAVTLLNSKRVKQVEREGGSIWEINTSRRLLLPAKTADASPLDPPQSRWWW